jgi:hypothetical protein
MTPCSFQMPTVTMLMEKLLPVGWMKPPLPSGIGRENVPWLTPVTAVRLSLAIRIGCWVTRVSGAQTNWALRSAMWRSMPSV